MQTTTTVTAAEYVETYAHDPRVTVTVDASRGVAEVRCSCCERRGDATGPRAFGPKTHQKWCDLAGETAHRLVSSAKVAAKAPAATANDRPIRVAGHEFETEDDVVMAVRCGGISMGAAMNRDTD